MTLSEAGKKLKELRGDTKKICKINIFIFYFLDKMYKMLYYKLKIL